jgi:hypothetical protein
MQTSRIIALTGLAAAVAVSTAYPTDGWGEDEDFGPIPDQLGNSSNGSNGTNSTTTTTITTTTVTTVTTTTTLPKYDFINFAYFMVGEASAPPATTTAGPVASRVGNGTAGNTTTTTTVTTTAEPTPTPFTPNDNTCSINAPGQKAYYAKLGRTGCNCTAMPSPPRGWEAWDGIHWNMANVPHYQLTMATHRGDINAVASLHAFCDSTCTNCTVHRSSDATKPMQDTCVSQEPLAPEILDYNQCNQASEVTTESFFIREPADVDHMGEEFCVLVEQAAAEEGAFTVIEYPKNTDCDANGTNPLYREGAMMGQTFPVLQSGDGGTGVCTAAYDGSFYKMYTEFDTATNETVYDGVINCMSVDVKEADLCKRQYCDYLSKVPVGKCAEVNTGDADSSYSTKFIGSGEVSQCFIHPKPSPNPTPKPSSKKGGNKGVVIGAVVAGIAVVAVVVLVIRKRRSSKAQAYSVLQGSAYTEN